MTTLTLSFHARPLVLALAGALALPFHAALAQTAPDAGRVLRETQPEPRPLEPLTTPGVRVPDASAPAAGTAQVQNATELTIQGVRLSGHTVFSEAVLMALVADLPGSQRTLGQLQQAAARITRHYRDAGYLVARAYLPQQKLEGGILHIAVLEGELADVRLMNRSRLPDGTVRGYLDVIERGVPPQREALDRQVLLLSDVPGVGMVQARLAAGDKPGQTVLHVDTTEADPMQARLEADNHGGLYTGRARAGASVQFDGALGWGERVNVRMLGSESDLLSGRIAVQWPLGVTGLSANAALGHTTYRLGDTFEALDARGRSDSLELGIRYPLVRRVDASLYALAGLEARDLRDEIRSTGTVSDKRAQVASLGLVGDWNDALGAGAVTKASLGYSGGLLSLVSDDSKAIDAATARTSGKYEKWSWSLERQQALGPGLTLLAAVRGQQASKNLDSSEKFSLGGASGVRAYASGEASGDEGWLASLELRHALSATLWASIFHDAGQVRVNAKPYLLSSSNTQRRSGSGLGLQGWYGALDWRISLAWRDADLGTAEPDHKVRLWAAAGWRF